MRAPDIWTRTDSAARIAVSALAPFGWIYGATVAWKAKHAMPFRPKAKIVCIGNLTAGGSGKTPITMAVARALMARRFRPVILSRGYRGRIRGPAFVDLATNAAAKTGDEPLLLAQAAPVIVARDRAAGARLADAEGFDAVVMDDGHQNFSVAKDLSIVVVDAETGFGNGHILPAGPLREPVAQGLARADAVILAGDGTPNLQGFSGPVLRARLVPANTDRLNGASVVAFAGIGRPQKFFDTLKALGANIGEACGYADHHVYTAAEVARLKAKARDNNAMLITTEKDFVRLAPLQRENIAVLSVRAVFDDAQAFDNLLERFIPAPAGNGTA